MDGAPARDVDTTALTDRIRNHRFDGYTDGMLANEVERFRTGPGIGSIGTAVDAMKAVAGELARTDQTLRDELGKLGVDWKGDAAETASNAVGTRADFSADANAKVSQSAELIFAQGEAFNRTLHKLPEPNSLRQGGGDLNFGDVLGSLIGFETDHAKKVNDAREARQQTVEALNGYAMASGDNLSGADKVPEADAIQLVSGPGAPGSGVDAVVGANPVATDPATAPSGVTGTTPSGLTSPAPMPMPISGAPGYDAPAPAPSQTGTPAPAPVVAAPYGSGPRPTAPGVSSGAGGGSGTQPSGTQPSNTQAPAQRPSPSVGLVPGSAGRPGQSHGGSTNHVPSSGTNNGTGNPGATVPNTPAPHGQPGNSSPQNPQVRPGGPVAPVSGPPAAGGQPTGTPAPGGTPGVAGKAGFADLGSDNHSGQRSGGGSATDGPLAKGASTGAGTPSGPTSGSGAQFGGAAVVPKGAGGGMNMGAAAMAAGAAGGVGAASGDQERRGRGVGRSAPQAGQSGRGLPISDLPDEFARSTRNAENVRGQSGKQQPGLMDRAAPQDAPDEFDAAHVRRYGVDDGDLFSDKRMVSPETIGDDATPRD